MSLEVPAAFDVSRSLNHGLEMLKRQPVGLLLGSFLLWITTQNSGGNMDLPIDNLDQDAFQDPAVIGVIVGAMAAGIGIAVCCGIVLLVFQSWLKVGYYRLQRELVVEGFGGAGVLFSGGDRFVPMLLWHFLSAAIQLGVVGLMLAPPMLGVAAAAAADSENALLAVLLGSGLWVLLMCIPSLYISIGLWHGDRAVALDDMAPMEALAFSWELADGNRISLVAFYFVMGLLKLFGVCLCCIGTVPVMSIVDSGATEAYLLATRDDWEDFALVEELGL